jgi:thiol peroxidase
VAQIKLKDNIVNTYADLPPVGSDAPDFRLTTTAFKDISLKDFTGKRILLNIFPSIDTGVCQASVRRFNDEVQKLANTVVLCVSTDLPFAHKRFCAAEGLENVISASALRTRSFGKDYGVMMADGAWEGLFSRAVLIIDEKRKVIYRQQVPVTGEEPDYQKAIEILK